MLNKYTMWNRKMDQWKVQKQRHAYRDMRRVKYCCHISVEEGGLSPKWSQKVSE